MIILILFEDYCDTVLKPLQLRFKSIVITHQSHRFYVLIALSLLSGMNGDEKELNRREK